MSEKKGKPKRDGSGRGVRANIGRGGCEPIEEKGFKENTTQYFKKWRRALRR